MIENKKHEFVYITNKEYQELLRYKDLVSRSDSVHLTSEEFRDLRKCKEELQKYKAQEVKRGTMEPIFVEVHGHFTNCKHPYPYETFLFHTGAINTSDRIHKFIKEIMKNWQDGLNDQIQHLTAPLIEQVNYYQNMSLWARICFVFNKRKFIQK